MVIWIILSSCKLLEKFIVVVIYRNCNFLSLVISWAKLARKLLFLCFYWVYFCITHTVNVSTINIFSNKCTSWYNIARIHYNTPICSTHISRYISTRSVRSYELKPDVCIHYPYKKKKLWNSKWIDCSLRYNLTKLISVLTSTKATCK